MVDIAGKGKQGFRKLEGDLVGALPIVRGGQALQDADPIKDFTTIRNEMLHDLVDNTRHQAKRRLQVEDRESEIEGVESELRLDEAKGKLEELREGRRVAKADGSSSAVMEMLFAHLDAQGKGVEEMRHQLEGMRQDKQAVLLEKLIGEVNTRIGGLERRATEGAQSKDTEGDFLDQVEKVMTFRTRIQELFPQAVMPESGQSLTQLALVHQQKMSEKREDAKLDLDREKFKWEKERENRDLTDRQQRGEGMLEFLQHDVAPSLKTILGGVAERAAKGGPPAGPPASAGEAQGQVAHGVGSCNCPGCGILVAVHEDQNMAVCPSCGSYFKLEDDAGHGEEQPRRHNGGGPPREQEEA